MRENIVLRNRNWSRLQFITNGASIEEVLLGAQMALDGGCKWIQLRMKDMPSLIVEAAAIALKPQCRKHGAVLIIDDYVDICKSLSLDGVHLGLTDMPINEARAILGEEAIIGGTANTAEQALHQVSLGADYLGVGPFRFTKTKTNLSSLLGVEGYTEVLKQLRVVSNIPVVAIGGVELEDVDNIAATGVDGVAVSGDILRAKNPVMYTDRWIEALNVIK